MIQVSDPTIQTIVLHGRELDILRLDAIHPEVGGNKWYKLKYNLEKCLRSDTKTLLTFGGPWSNHIYATAAAGSLLGLRTIGIIRGEEPLKWSETLRFARDRGMDLHFISRESYRLKETEDFRGWLNEEFGSFHLIPEGGSNYLGVNGCMEICTPAIAQNYDVICCACGTGATMAGIILSTHGNLRYIAFPSMKGGGFMGDEIRGHIKSILSDTGLAVEMTRNLHVDTRWHFGGYGKWDNTLIEFIHLIGETTGVPLDQIYTGKMLFGLSENIRRGEFLSQDRILVVHSGGLQGRRSAGL